MSRQLAQAARLDTEAPEKPAGAFKAGEHMVWAAGVRWRVEAVRPVDRHTIEVDLAGDNGRTLARRLARDRPVGYALDT